MTTINLKDYYPWYIEDCFVEVADDIAMSLKAARREDRSYLRRVLYNNAQYSLDAEDGIEIHALFHSLSACEECESKLMKQQVYAAIGALPKSQGRRIYAHYILGISQTELAKAEGVSDAAVSIAIDRGLKNMRAFLKNIL